MDDDKPPQQSQQEVLRLAVSIHRVADGRWVVEELRLVGYEVAAAAVLTTLDSTKGVRVVAGTFSMMADDCVQEWQKEGVLK
jgi:hypothetical protein